MCKKVYPVGKRISNLEMNPFFACSWRDVVCSPYKDFGLDSNVYIMTMTNRFFENHEPVSIYHFKAKSTACG
jgi:hypothetical protein